MAQLLSLPLQRATSATNTLLPGALLDFFLTGTTTRADVYTDEDLSTVHANPVVADSGGAFPAIYLDPTQTYRARLRTSAGVAVPGMDFDPITGFGGGAGTLHAKDFGAIGDGVTDDTAALLAMLTQMQDEGKPGILGGEGEVTTYLVQTGQLVWANASTTENEAGPTLHTAGRVVLKVKTGSLDAPIIHIHNESGTGGKYVHGSYIGPLEFLDETADVATARHALQLYGVEFMNFGVMDATGLKGDVVHIEDKGSLTTGDRWHVTGCHFEGIIGRNTSGWALNNNSKSQFFSGNKMDVVANYLSDKGAWRGQGAGNELLLGAAQGTLGWAFDFETSNGSDSTQGLTVHYMELDAPEYGIRINGLQSGKIRARLVYRYRDADVAPTPGVADESKRINGGVNGLADREAKFNALVAALLKAGA